jgi:opacity protein-like surface antigen
MKNLRVAGLLSFLISSPIFALWNPVVTASVGGSQSKIGTSQTIYLDEFSNTYVSSSGSSKTKVFAGIFAGAERVPSSNKFSTEFSCWRYQLGIGLYQNEASKASGVVNEFSIPEYNNLDFNYYVRSRYALAEGRVLYIINNFLAPYVMVGGGVVRNKAHGYLETPRIDTAVPMTPFANKTKTTGAYTLGGGLEFIVFPNVRFGAGYRFADLGSAELGVSPAQTTTNTLKINKVEAHQFIFQITAVG